MVSVFSVFPGLLDDPGEGGAERLVQHRSAGFADGLQPTESPITRTVLPQLTHEQAVRQHHQVHVPGLALAVAKLTVSHAKLLLTVPMIGLRACPTMPIRPQDATHFPCRPVGDQDFARFRVTAVIPEDDDPHLVIHLGDVERGGEVPLPVVAATEFLAVFRRNRRCQGVGTQFLPLPLQFPIELQVAHVGPRPPMLVLLGVDVVEVVGVGEIAVEREIAGNFPLADPIDQLAEQHRVILERLAGGLALLPLLEAAELQRVMLAAGANVVDEQVVMGDLVAVLGVVPKPPHVLDELAVVVDERVVQRDHALVAVAGRRVALQQFESPLVECLLVPGDFREKPIQARLIGGLDELAVDPGDGLVRRHHQAR